MYRSNEKSNFSKGLIVGVVVTLILVGIILLFSRCGKKDENKTNSSQNDQQVVAPNDSVAVNQNYMNNVNQNTNSNENLNTNTSNNTNTTVLTKDASDTSGKAYSDNFNGQNFSFNVPSSWKTDETQKNKVGLVDSASTVGDDKGDIVFTFKSNKQNYDFERYYDGLNDVNYFTDASSGFEKFTINGMDAYKFKNVAGYSNSTIISVKTNGGYVEISDMANKYQNDGIFEKVVQSFEVK